MTTLTDKKKSYRTISMLAALLALLPALVFAGSFVLAERVETGRARPEAVQTSGQDVAPASASREWSSPAIAASLGKPALLLFTPYEVCQIRYCPQPQLVAERLEQQVGDEVTFVPVTVYAAPATTAGSDTPQFNLDNWDLYLVPPYDTWLPPLQETQFGLALQAPVYTLVDSRGNVVSQMHHFPDVGRVVKAE